MYVPTFIINQIRLRCLPTLVRISNTLHVVLFEITDFPAKSWALTPSPAVIRSLLKRIQCPGKDGMS